MKRKQKRLSFDEMRERFQVKEYHRRKAALPLEEERTEANDLALLLVQANLISREVWLEWESEEEASPVEVDYYLKGVR